MTNFSKLVLKMTEYEGGCGERGNHFLKVFAFAKTIAEGDDVDDATKEILEAAAITHDIGIRECFEKYGSHIFYCSDEMYLRAGLPLPEDENYED